MRIYTKTGDKGMTKLVGGYSVAKDSDRVESYGTVDELNAWIGFSISVLDAEYEDICNELTELQNFLFDVGTDLSTPKEAKRPIKLQNDSIHWLESKIDQYTDKSPDIEQFILPGGSKGASMMQVARALVRRAERCIVRLNTTAPVNEDVIKFINRLSDYFYALGRYLNVQAGVKDVYYERGEKVFHKIKEEDL